MSDAAMSEYLYDQFDLINFSNCKGIQDYVNKFLVLKADIDNHDNRGCSADFFKTQILKGLPSNWDGFKENYAFHIGTVGALDFNSFTNRLLTFEPTAKARKATKSGGGGSGQTPGQTPGQKQGGNKNSAGTKDDLKSDTKPDTKPDPNLNVQNARKPTTLSTNATGSTPNWPRGTKDKNTTKSASVATSDLETFNDHLVFRWLLSQTQGGSKDEMME